MNPYTSEEVMWERLKDIQREVENARLLRGRQGRGWPNPLRSLGHALGLLPRWWARPDVREADADRAAKRDVA